VAMRRVVADHNVASSFNNIARIYEQQGKYEEALENRSKSRPGSMAAATI
jgi:hypothetical protein